MPQIFKIGSYTVFFWANENDPLEPIHVHVAEGKARDNSTKIWITKTGKCLLANNMSNIPKKKLKMLMHIIEANSEMIMQKWITFFDEMDYYC